MLRGHRNQLTKKETCVYQIIISTHGCCDEREDDAVHSKVMHAMLRGFTQFSYGLQVVFTEYDVFL